MWVPIVVAVVGLAGVVVTQALVTRREARRTREEAAREERRFERERETRTREARATAYAQLIGGVEAFDLVVYPALQLRETGRDLDATDAAELREGRAKLREPPGPTVLHAPEANRDLIKDAVLPWVRLANALLDAGRDPDGLRAEWDAGQRGYRILRMHMRRDLGFDTETAERIDRALAERSG